VNTSDQATRKVQEKHRLATALRDNLKRRKAQARGRNESRDTAETTGDGGVKPHDSAGIGEDK
jgi:hypothetical protein